MVHGTSVEAARRVVSLELSQPDAGCPSLLPKALLSSAAPLATLGLPKTLLGWASGAGCAAASRHSKLGGRSRLSPTQWGTATAFSSREKTVELVQF